MTFTIHENGKRPRAWCVECGKPHPSEKCLYAQAYPRYPKPITVRTLRLRLQIAK